MNMVDWLKKHVEKSLAIPVIISGANWGAMLFASLSDGNIDDAELHQLITSSSGFEMGILLVIMAILKLKSKQ